MCEFCIQHGEGKKWYLQAKNYSEELFNEERKRYMAEFFVKIEETVINDIGGLDKLIATDPAAAEVKRRSVMEKYKKEHYGQVIPIEDVEQILDMSIIVVRIPCACRSILKGRFDARYCFGLFTFQPDPAPTLEYPDWTTDLEVLTVEDAKKALQKHDRNGLVHTVWTLITPFVGGICNCTANDCLHLKNRSRLGLRQFFKAEYVASIDWESCSGCRDCMKLCNFGAISYSPSLHRCYINRFDCFGCGVCRAVCTKDAITLQDRNAIPALVKDW
jgi:ferredoxin